MGMKARDLKGLKFGKLLVLERIEDIRKGHPSWLCLCDCGNYTKKTSGVLVNGQVKSCGCLYLEAGKRILVDLTGQRFGYLVVLERAENKGTHTQWWCMCDCGEKISVSASNLSAKTSTSCGCRGTPHIRKKKGNRDNPKAWAYGLFDDYKRNAEKRGRPFSLSLEEFIEITSRNCHYCGLPPTNMKGSFLKNPYIYNGIDRIENDRGYEVENSLPCCYGCNLAKNVTSQSDFLAWIKRITEYQSILLRIA